MAYRIAIIQPSGTVMHETTDAVPDNKRIKRGLNGGWLETVPHFDMYGALPCVVFGDEEAKLKGLAINGRATYLWYACLAGHPFRPDTLHGPIYIVAADTENELRAL